MTLIKPPSVVPAERILPPRITGYKLKPLEKPFVVIDHGIRTIRCSIQAIAKMPDGVGVPIVNRKVLVAFDGKPDEVPRKLDRTGHFQETITLPKDIQLVSIGVEGVGVVRCDLQNPDGFIIKDRDEERRREEEEKRRRQEVKLNDEVALAEETRKATELKLQEAGLKLQAEQAELQKAEALKEAERANAAAAVSHLSAKEQEAKAAEAKKQEALAQQKAEEMAKATAELQLKHSQLPGQLAAAQEKILTLAADVQVLQKQNEELQQQLLELEVTKNEAIVLNKKNCDATREAILKWEKAVNNLLNQKKHLEERIAALERELEELRSPTTIDLGALTIEETPQMDWQGECEKQTRQVEKLKEQVEQFKKGVDELGEELKLFKPFNLDPISTMDIPSGFKTLMTKLNRLGKERDLWKAAKQMWEQVADSRGTWAFSFCMLWIGTVLLGVYGMFLISENLESAKKKIKSNEETIKKLQEKQ